LFHPCRGDIGKINAIGKHTNKKSPQGADESAYTLEMPDCVFPMVTTDSAAFIDHLCFFSSAGVFISFKQNLKILFLGLGPHIKISASDSLLGNIGFWGNVLVLSSFSVTFFI
jgi:hypothetical protein